MQDVSEGEPPVKQRKHKRTLVADRDAYTAMPLTLWNEFVLKRHYGVLLLEDLVALKRTCKSFATFKPLRRLIKDKEEAAFGGFDKKYWNRLALDDYNIRHKRDGFYDQHPGQYFFWFIGVAYKDMLGVFSNKRRLWDVFWKHADKKKIMLLRNLGRPDMTWLSNDGKGYMCVQGIAKELQDWFETTKNK